MTTATTIKEVKQTKTPQTLMLAACIKSKTPHPPPVDPNTVEHPAQWLQRKIHTLSPSSNSSSSVQSCPALASSNFSPPPRPAPDTYFGTLGVTGELQLRLGGTGSKLASEGDVETWMRGLSGFVSNTSAVLASFSTAIQKSDDTAVLMLVPLLCY